MSRPSFFTGVLAAVFVAAMTAAPAPVSANTYDNLAYLTFSGPVQIPGQTTLGAGTYRFRLANADSGRNVIQVLSNDGNHVYGMFQTMPDYRSVVTEEATVTFMEVPSGVAPPIKSLFYADESHGYQFIYGRGEPNITAPIVKPQPEIGYTANAAPVATGPTVAATPAPAAVTTAPAGTAPSTEPEPLAGSTEPATLPATGSAVPATAFGGFVMLVVGLGLGLLRRHGA